MEQASPGPESNSPPITGRRSPSARKDAPCDKNSFPGEPKIGGTNSYTDGCGIPIPLTLHAIGLAFGAAAVIPKFSPRGWISFALIAPAAAMLNAFSVTQSTHFGEQRLVDNLVGVALVIAAGWITIGFAHFTGHGDSDDKIEIAEFSPA